MKKSVVILIALIYVSAIALVSFFGLQFKVFDQIIPVESVEILNEGLKESGEWGKYTPVMLDSNGNAEYTIQTRILPDDASNKVITYVVTDEALRDRVTVDDKNGKVTITGITEFTPLKILVASADNPEAKQYVTLLLIPQ